MKKGNWLANALLVLSWAINLAGIVGYLLLRRRIAAPEAIHNHLRLLILRPYRTESDSRGAAYPGDERDELRLMNRLFAAARKYGNARVLIVTNQGDPGLQRISQLAASYGELVRVVEASPNITHVTGKVHNLMVGWQTLAGEARDEDVLLTSDSDSLVTAKLLRQVAAAYEDAGVGGVGSYSLYVGAKQWAALPDAMAFSPGMGLLALDSAVQGQGRVMSGNLSSMRVAVFRSFGGYASLTENWQQLADDVAVSRAVLSTGHKLVQVGIVPVYNRYASLRSWWERWTRQMLAAKLSVPYLFYASPIPTYGVQAVSMVLLGYGAWQHQRRFSYPFFSIWGTNLLYGGITGAWWDALLSPLTCWLSLAGWLYVLLTRQRSVNVRGVAFSIEKEVGG